MELFLFDKKERAFVHPEAVKLTQYIKKLSKPEATYVILAYDYKSKYHMFPLEDRKRRAKREIFPGTGDLDVEAGNEILKEAIQEYCDLQYDPLRETLRTYINKIAQLQEKLINAIEHNEIRNIDKTLGILEKRLDEINDKIYKSEQEEVKLRGKKKESFIEAWQRKMVIQRKAREQQKLNEGIEMIS